MPKVGKMRFPYTRQGMDEAQKYQNALSPEQEQMKRALEQSIAGQRKAIEQGIKEVQREISRRKILEMIEGSGRKDRMPMPYKKGGKVKKY
tara:strand:- start:155 stop:427 length:273 start_codon:yes stop_codon:yes gene_type:complete